MAIGDPFSKSTVKDIQDLIVLKNGDLVLHVDINSGEQNVMLFRSGNYVAPAASIVVQANPNLRVLTANTVNSVDTVLFTGLPPSGGGSTNGLYRWQGSTVSLVLAQNAPITYIHAATIGSKGDIAVAARRSDNDFVVLKQNGSTLFGSGAGLNLSTPLHLTHIITGSRTGLPSIMLGDPSSTFDVPSPDTIAPRVRVGDRLSDGSGFSGATDIIENSSGAQFFLSTPGGLFQAAGGTTKLLLALNPKAPDGVGLLLRKLWAVNNAGAVLLEAITTLASQQRRLYILDTRAALTLVSSTGDASPFGADVVTGWEQAAIDETNHVMMLVDSGSDSGLVLYNGATKVVTLRLGQTMLGGETAVFVANLKATGGRFYARISLTVDFYHSCIAMYDSAWHVLAQSGSTLPNTEILGYLQNSDADANGDVIFTAQVLPSGGSAVVAWHVADGSLRIVHENSGPTDSGDYLERYADVNLRDDGTVFFLAFDVYDRVLVFRCLATGK